MNKSSKLRDRIKEATAAAILEAAEVVYAEEGLHSARVESIALKAGTSVGTLYTYFKDRDGIVTALTEARRAELVSRLDEALAKNADRPFAEQAQEALFAILSTFQAHRPFFSILHQGEVGGGTQRAESSASNMKATMKALRTRLAVLTERAVQDGILRPELNDLYAFLLLGLVRSTLIHDLVLETAPVDERERSRQLVRFFMEGGGVRDGGV